MKWVIIFCSLTFTLFAEDKLKEDILVSNTSVKDVDTRENFFLTSNHQKINPYVDPITGEFVQQKVDLVVAGSQPLSLRRFYNHFAPYNPRYACWRYNPETFVAANFELKIKGMEFFAAVGDESGGVTLLDVVNNNVTYNQDHEKGFCNFSQSGQNHPKNIKLSFNKKFDPKNKDRFVWYGELRDGSGGLKLFNSPMHAWMSYVHKREKWQRNGIAFGEKTYRIHPAVWTPYQLSISEERLPNGNIIAYTYERWKDEVYPKPPLLSTIKAYNSDRTQLLGSLTFYYHRKKHEEIGGIEIVGSDNRKVSASHVGESPIVLSAITSSEHPRQFYNYKGTAITSIGENGVVTNLIHYDEKTGKVICVSGRLGPYGEFEPVSNYAYFENSTVVLDAEKNKSLYRYDTNKRLTSLEKYQGNYLYSIEKYTWDNFGNLIRKNIENSSGVSLLLNEYVYDKNHNVIEERIGDGKNWDIKKYTYSHDGFNLKISETDRPGKEIRYSYIKNTNLISSELLYLNNKIQKRIFYSYDKNATLIKKIIDDGKSVDVNNLSDVTCRKVTIIKPKAEFPCLGLPEIIEEKTINDLGQEILLSKKIVTYTYAGKPSKEDYFDSSNKYLYSIVNEYDSRERVILRTDPLGNKVTYTYDDKDNLICICGPRVGERKEWTYDFVNRPIEEREWMSDGNILIRRKKYDKNGKVVSELDEYNFEKKFQYDSLGRITKIINPDGSIEKKEYDILGNLVSETDRKGYSTKKEFNFRGQPTSILYPDGTREQFTYNSTGTLSSFVDKNGSKTLYSYDLLDRPLQIDVYCSKGKLLKTTKKTYSAFNLLSEVDGEGNTTYFSYDYEGKKISEKIGNKVTTFFYDSLGRLSKTQSKDHAELLEYNNLNYITCKKTTDLNDQIILMKEFTYDAVGNQTKIITSKGTTEINYNLQNRMSSKKDPIGNITTFAYSYIGGLRITSKDPKGIQNIHIHDSEGRESEFYKKNLKNEIIQKSTKTYDYNGNPTLSTFYVYAGSNLLRTITHKSIYGPNNRLESFIEAGEKETKYFYDDKGRLASKILPNKNTLFYQYDDLGRLIHYFSKDFDYSYTFDKNNRISIVKDNLNNKLNSRIYDLFGNVTSETLFTGFTINNQYDDQGRRVKITLPNHKSINYSYLNNRLHEVSYKGLSHFYNEIDREGCIKTMTLPLNLGQIEIDRDALGRWKKFTSPFYQSNFDKNSYDSVNNLCNYSFTDPFGSKECKFEYDELNQLVSEDQYSYQCDSINNRLNKNGSKYQINNLCEIINDGSCTYKYDPNGNLIGDGKSQFFYDSLNRLTKVKQASKTITYYYDTFDRRLRKEVIENEQPISQEFYLWDGNEEIGSFDDSKNLKELRVLGRGLGAEIGASVILELNNVLYVPIHDHRGSLVTIIDIEKEYPKETYRYTAFGEELFRGDLSPWRFASKRIDPETGFVFFGKRYLFPLLGTWISPDPQGFGDGPNLYAYLHHNPLMSCDLYGLMTNPFAGTRNGFDFLSRCFRPAFRAMEFTGQHLLPIPYMRDVVESVGRWGAGGKLFAPCAHHINGNQVITLPGKITPGESLTYKDGMNTSRAAAINDGIDIQSAHGGAQIDILYNGSKGFVSDFCECALAKLGVNTAFEKMCANYYLQKLNIDPNHLFTDIVHSQAGTHEINMARLMNNEVAGSSSRIGVQAFGPSTIIPNDGTFRFVQNYVSRLDVVPMTCPIGYLKGIKNGNITFLEPHSMSPLNEHFIRGETYWKKLCDIGRQFYAQNFVE